ncbi:hypothetical protein C8Q73DRAFT_667332 [Cubamyces lactineus]|nr:hypothetical protein C8Q73DRAFT_667332 [Cubamyces lactineus]
MPELTSCAASSTGTPQSQQAPDLFSDFTDWCSNNRVSDALSSAIVSFRQKRDVNRKLHRYVAARLGLNRTEGKAWLETTQKYYLHRLADGEAYPPLRHHIVESDVIEDLWKTKLEDEPLKEPRQDRRPLHRLQPERLQLMIAEDEDAILIDADDGSIIAVVMRGVTGPDCEKEFLGWATAAIKDGILGRRSIRRDDPGMMVQSGYTPGSRHKPLFNWVRNLVEPNQCSPEFLASSDYAASCLLAVCWNICCARLPAEVMDDWVKFLQDNKIPVLDAGVAMVGTRGDYTIQFGDESVTFHDAELAPGTALLNWNYARFGYQFFHIFRGTKDVCRAIHFECPPHTYAIQWITERTHGTPYGGHFYIASYGVRILNTTDTLIAWRPKDFHGTSLAAFSPYTVLAPEDPHPSGPSPPYAQSGVCLTASQRMGNIKARYLRSFKAKQAQGARVGNTRFRKRWTAEDEAAEEAAKEFVEQMVAGIMEAIE